MSCDRRFLDVLPKTLRARCCACHRRNPLLRCQSEISLMLNTFQLTAISRIHLHGLISVDFLQGRAGPFPKSSHFAETCQFVPVLGDRYWMPAFETDVGIFKIGEEWIRIGTSCNAGGPVRQMLGWRSLFHAFIDEVAMAVSVVTSREEMIMRLPVNCWNHSAKSLGDFLLLQRIGIVVDTPRFFQGGNTSTHVPRTTREFIERGSHLDNH